jgi:hypothetical protein
MQQKRGQVWYFFSDAVPDGELMIPIVSDHGLAIAVKPNAGIDQKTLDELQRVADHVLGVGIAHLNVGGRLLTS